MATTGKALVITASGGTEVFSLVEAHPIRAPDVGEVLVKLVATSVNPVDVYVRSGMYASKTFPKVIGGDLAGHVVALGNGSSSKFEVGDAVFALSDAYIPYSAFEGTYAEYALVKEEWVAKAPVPDNLPLVHAAGVPLVYLTALQALEKARPQPGQRILVLGGSGAVGQFGVQLAKVLHGLHVTAVSSPAYADVVASLGADTVWDYTAGGALDAAFADAPFDIVFDVIGGALLDASAKVLKAGGVITHIQNRGSGDAPARYKAAHEAGTGPRFEATLVQPSGPGLEQAAELFNAGKIRIKVAQTLPLADAGKAHDIVIDGHAGGKIVLTL